MQQLEYWFNKYPNWFYKFTEPCNHEVYKEGDSWCEELGFSRSEFTTAFNGLGVKYKSKTEYNAAQEDKFQGKYYMAYTDRKQGLTYYYRNHEVVDNALNELVTRYESTSEGNENTERENSELRNATKANYGTEGHDVAERDNVKFDLYTETTPDINSDITHAQTRESENFKNLEYGKEAKNERDNGNSRKDNNESPSWKANKGSDMDQEFRNSPTREKDVAPFTSREEMNKFKDSLLNYAVSSGKYSPSGFVHAIVEEAIESQYEHPYLKEWREGQPIGLHEKQEWEASPNKPYPYFVNYLKENLRRQDYSETQALEQANYICRHPNHARPHWEAFKNRVSNEAKQKQKQESTGATYYEPTWSQDNSTDFETAGDAIAQLKNSARREDELSLESDKSSTKQIEGKQEEGFYPEENPLEFVKEMLSDPNLETAWNDNFTKGIFHNGILKAIAHSNQDEEETIFQLLLDNNVTREWTKEKLGQDYDF